MTDYLPVDEPLGGPGGEPQPSRRYMGGFVSLHYVAKALGRRKAVWITLAVVGIVFGASLPKIIPAKYSAVSTLYLTQNPNDDPVRDMATDVALLESEAVAKKVVDKLHLSVTPQKLTSSYTGDAVTGNVLQITLSAPSSAEAVRRLDTLDDEFLSFRNTLLDNQTSAVVGNLQSQVNSLNTQINTLTNEIGHTTDTATVNSLTAQKANLLSEQNSLQQTIYQTESDTTLIINQSSVESTASAVVHSATKTLLVDAASGLIGGAALGLGIVAAMAILSDRIRQRDEFADAANAPVELSVGRVGRIRVMRRRRLRRRLSRPGRPVELISRYLRAITNAGPQPKTMAVVSLDTLEPAALSMAILAGRLAVFEGKRVMVMDLSPGRVLGELLGVSRPDTRIVFVKGAWVPVLVSVPPEDDPVVELPTGVEVDGVEDQSWSSPEVVLVLTTIDPGVGAGHLRPVVDEAVLVATAGRSNAAQVRTTSEMLRAAGVDLRSVVVVGADQNDDSLGLFAPDPSETRLPVGFSDLVEAPMASAGATESR